MLTKIGVENFKIFKKMVIFDLRPLMVLTGPNSSGKSTFNKLLYLISNGFKFTSNEVNGPFLDSIERLYFNDKIEKVLGHFDNCIPRGSSKAKLKLYFGFNSEEESIRKHPIDANLELRYAKYEFWGKGLIVPEDSKFLIMDQISFSDGKNKLFSMSKTTIKEMYPEFEFEYPRVKIWHTEKCNYSNIRNFFLKTKRNELLEFGKEDFSLYMGGMDLQREYLYLNARNVSDNLLVQSHFSKVVLGDNNFFEREFEHNSYNGKLLRELIVAGIHNRKDFIENYQNFEESLIEKYFKERLFDNYKVYDSEDPYFKEGKRVKNKKLDNILTFNRDSNLTKQQLIELLESIENPLLSVFLEELNHDKSKAELIYRNRDSKNLHHLKFNSEFDYLTFEGLNNLYHLFWIKVAGLYLELKNSVSESVSSYREVQFHKQNQPLRPYYMVNDKQTEEEDLMKLALKFQKFEGDVQVLFFINKWLKELGIGESLIIDEVINDGEVIGFTFSIKDLDNSKQRIEDLGLGVRNILLILIKLSLTGENYFERGDIFYDIPVPDKARQNIRNLDFLESKLILIEEPESNLHPSYQSKLAEIFVDAMFHLKIRFVIETHSEYLIRKLQYLIAVENQLLSEDVAIHYLYNPKQIPNGEKQVYKLEIRPDGFMNNDFGKGFFDEASSLSLGLLGMANFN